MLWVPGRSIQMKKGPVSRGRATGPWNPETPAWEMQRARPRGQVRQGREQRPHAASLRGLVNFILRAVRCPRGTGILVVVRLCVAQSDLHLIVILAAVSLGKMVRLVQGRQ